jgi:hypothetical protein
MISKPMAPPDAEDLPIQVKANPPGFNDDDTVAFLSLCPACEVLRRPDKASI